MNDSLSHLARRIRFHVQTIEQSLDRLDNSPANDSRWNYLVGKLTGYRRVLDMITVLEND